MSDDPCRSCHHRYYRGADRSGEVYKGVENAVTMYSKDFLSSIEHIVTFLQSAGYDPYEQLKGYLLTGKDIYITRTGDARSLIKMLDKEVLLRYVNEQDRRYGSE